MVARILIVDDDELILRAYVKVLRDHDVVAVHSALEALAAVQAGARFDVIVSDLVMPEMTGMQLHAALVEVARDQADAMVFASGSLDDPSARAFIARVPNEAIEKPVPVAALRELVARRLAGKPPR